MQKIKTTRRGFLGLFGSAAVAGPTVVKEAVTDMESHLRMPYTSMIPDGDTGIGEIEYGKRDTNWAKDMLKKWVGKTAVQEEREKRHFHIYAFDANTAALRSMSVVNKVRISREKQWNEHKKRQKEYYNGIVKGWWDA